MKKVLRKTFCLIFGHQVEFGELIDGFVGNSCLFCGKRFKNYSET